MKKLFYVFTILSCIVVAFSKSDAKPKKNQGPPLYQAKAEMFNSDGVQIGRAVFFDEGSNGVRMVVEVIGIPAGRHGIHIHENGICERPGFQSAGNHFNPHSKKHGFQNKSGPHGGDLPNLRVEDESLAGRLEYTLPDLSMREGKNSLFKPNGTSLIIHASYDDEISDPAGNSGARIACGVIQPVF